MIAPPENQNFQSIPDRKFAQDLKTWYRGAQAQLGEDHFFDIHPGLPNEGIRIGLAFEPTISPEVRVSVVRDLGHVAERHGYSFDPDAFAGLGGGYYLTRV